jgi:uncharacterized protein YlxW (UPF0749 family)
MGYSAEKRKLQAAYTIVVSIAIIILVAMFAAIPDKITDREIRVYIWFFLLTFLIMTAGLFMARNATKWNTAYMIKLREQMHQNGVQIEQLNKTLRDQIKESQKLLKAMQNENDKTKEGDGVQK